MSVNSNFRLTLKFTMAVGYQTAYIYVLTSAEEETEHVYSGKICALIEREKHMLAYTTSMLEH